MTGQPSLLLSVCWLWGGFIRDARCEGLRPVTAEHQLTINTEFIGGMKAPVVGASGRAVADVVRVCHERTIDAGLAELSIEGLDRTSLDSLLTYCAEERCIGDAVTCPGCKLRTGLLGIETLDDFIARHQEIVVGDGGVRLIGCGEATVHVSSLAELEKSWAGEKYWYWARRVLRKLRHGIRRANVPGSPFAAVGESPSVILMEPQLADNVGMVARAMANFGLDDLRLIAPRDGWPNEKARIAASGANYVIDDAKAYPTLETAVGDLTWLVATTARQRDLRKPVMTPLEAVGELRHRIARGERCGVLFGRERSGLETTEVANADALVMIPVNSRFASLNLAQAVLIVGYEWMRGSDAQSLGRVTTYEKPLEEGLYMGADRPATKEELIGFFEHIEGELERLGFFNPSHRRDTVVRNLRTMFSRMGATDQEVRTLRGIVATLVKGKGHARKPSS
jgi:tRNA/rRNA methyltransferase